MHQGRLIPLLAAPGALQMALDDWLLEQHRQGLLPPCLRFYTWAPAAISLGYHQHRWPDHWRDVLWQEQPLDLVCRPSGGRAVLHQGDLTYALVVSSADCAAIASEETLSSRNSRVNSRANSRVNSRAIAYRRLCEFLIQGFQSLGVDLRFGDTSGQADRRYIHNPNCFGTATGADLLLADGTKFIGSAQLWRQGYILQHGSIRLNPDAELFEQVFGREAGRLATPTVASLGVASLSVEAVIAALTLAAQRCLAIEFQPQPLSLQEWAQVQRWLERSPAGVGPLDRRSPASPSEYPAL